MPTYTDPAAGHYEGEVGGFFTLPISLEVGRRKVASATYNVLGNDADGSPCFLSGTVSKSGGEQLPAFGLSGSYTSALTSERVAGSFASGTQVSGDIVAQAGSEDKVYCSTEYLSKSGVGQERGWTAHLCKSAKSKRSVPRGTPACKQVASGVDPKPGHYENDGTRAKHNYIAFDVTKSHRVTRFVYDQYATCAGRKESVSDTFPGSAALIRAVFYFREISTPTVTDITGVFVSATTARGVLQFSDVSEDKIAGCSGGFRWTARWKKR